MAQALHRSSSSSPLPNKFVSADLPRNPASTSKIFASQLKLGELEQTHLGLAISFKGRPSLRLMASRDSPGLAEELTDNKQKNTAGTENGYDLFNGMKHRFLSFKRHTFLQQSEHFQKLAEGQAPKFMVIACGDSRVCPSNILGFQPGEAFVIRNVANLVPPIENGPSETNAALEYAVNFVGVENILVIGHSRCGGIRALMSMEDEANSSSFIHSWVAVGNNARLSTKTDASTLNFDQQCTHCEKESIHRSLLNLLAYPWIKEKVAKGGLSIHGGYYDFVDCTFEKWTLDYHGSNCRKDGMTYSPQNREFWS